VTSYPTIDEVVAVHAQLIARFGGSPGIRDRGALESALARPQSGRALTRGEPAKMQTRSIFDSTSHDPLIGRGSVALEVGDSIYLGAFQGDRLVKIPYPK